MDYFITPPRQLVADVALPSSKSIAARALVAQALCDCPSPIAGAADCDDTLALRRGLAVTNGVIDVGASGTALRLLTAFHACRPGHDVVLDGDARLRERPMQPLIEALHALGAEISCLSNEGHAPLRVVGHKLCGGRVTLRAGQSSQFVTALMLIAPTVGGLEITLDGPVVSTPYIDMTTAVLRHYGVTAVRDGSVVSVGSGPYLSLPLEVEADWSAAAYWLALQALLPTARISLRGLQQHSWQGDSRILELLRQMGMDEQWQADGSLRAQMSRVAQCCCSTFADLLGTPDLAPPLATALCLLGRPFRLTGLRTLRHKESDRREALRTELAKLGYLVTIEGDDALQWHFERCPAHDLPVIDPHGDHRIAMSMALAATQRRLVVTNAEVVSKSYPTFWSHLRQAGFAVEER